MTAMILPAAKHGEVPLARIEPTSTRSPARPRKRRTDGAAILRYFVQEQTERHPVALSAGIRLGPYEIVAPLGAGGMGEVYRARDTRLGRDVAIKVVRPRLSADSDQLRRFEKEARAAAQLDHPNILVVHDFGTHERSPYIVSELLDGESLREKLGAPLPPKKAVEYAVQMAYGLAAAHEKGIVHRDLKPENLFVTKDGRVKILDFGVAKLTQPAIPSVSLTEAPTAAPASDVGVIMGTVGYMSPEQVVGTNLDGRSDLFSFGVVLYEMLSGRRPFQRETAPETMVAILREEPPDLTETNKTIPPGLDRIVRHCLEKDPSSRFQSARDVAFALESLSQTTTAGTAPIRAAKGGRKALTVSASLLAAAALIAVGALVHSRLSRLVQPRIKRLTFQRGQVTAARFLSDGQSVVYAAAWGDEPLQLYSVRLDSPGSRPIGFKEADLLAVSCNSELALGLGAGKRLIFTGMGPGTLAVAPFSGGAPRAVAERVLMADFSPDGRSMAAVVNWDQLEYPLGTVLRKAGPNFWISRMRVSPGGDRVAFFEHPRQDRGGAVTVTAAGGKATKLTRYFTDLNGVAWSPGGDEIWFSGAGEGARCELMAVSLSGRERRIFAGLGSVLLHDIGQDGRVLVSTLDMRRRLFFGSADRSADREISWFDWSGGTGISDDGKVALISEEGEAAGSSYPLFVRETDGSPPAKIGSLATGEGANISPDGRFVVVTRLRPPAIHVIPVGAGATRTIPLSGFKEEVLRPAGLTADGRTVWFVGSKPPGGRGYWITDLAGTALQRGSPENVALNSPGITPDGKSFLARLEGNRLALIPLAGGEPRIVEGVSGEDIYAGVANDGRSVFVYRRDFGFPVSIRRVDVATGRSEALREISPPDRGGAFLMGVSVTPDGRHLMYNTVQRLGDLYIIEGLK
jgi:hypothetical protein